MRWNGSLCLTLTLVIIFKCVTRGDNTAFVDDECADKEKFSTYGRSEKRCIACKWQQSSASAGTTSTKEGGAFGSSSKWFHNFFIFFIFTIFSFPVFGRAIPKALFPLSLYLALTNLLLTTILLLLLLMLWGRKNFFPTATDVYFNLIPNKFSISRKLFIDN